MYCCAVTGHRPSRFKFGRNENSEEFNQLKQEIEKQIIKLYDKGIRCFLLGGAEGVDMWAGEILLKLKYKLNYNDIKIKIVLPFNGHDLYWEENSRKRLKNLIENSDEIITMNENVKTDAEKYRKRNMYLVDCSDCLLAVYDTERPIARSGTGMTVRYAVKKGIPVIFVKP